MKKNDYQELYDALLKLETPQECEDFLDDLCTIKELDDMLQRIRAAKLLLENKTFQEVTNETKISSATLARVSKCVKYGNGGYKHIFEKKSRKQDK